MKRAQYIKVGEKGRVFIPKGYHELLGIEQGDFLVATLMERDEGEWCVVMEKSGGASK